MRILRRLCGIFKRRRPEPLSLRLWRNVFAESKDKSLGQDR